MTKLVFVALVALVAGACSGPSPSPPRSADETAGAAGAVAAPPAAAPPTEASSAPRVDPPSPPTPADSPEPPERLGDGDLGGVGAACRGEHACVLVHPGCSPVGAAPREGAAEAQERYDRIAAVAECARPQPIVPVEPVCTQSGCDVVPRPHPTVLGCRADRDCIPFEWGCQWTTVARAREAEARRLMPLGAACPGILPMPPEVRCTFGFCSLAIDAIPR